MVFSPALSIGQSKVWVSDQGDGTYINPIIHADYSDPDVCQRGPDFYMTASSFNAMPGLPILHSRDLVNWTIINHALPANVDSYFDKAQHGNGVWAPSFRFHDGLFYIYWGDPDRGIFMVQTDDPAGEWSAPVLVKKAYGNIDPCPLWDDDGRVYMVHAFAHSRAGVKSLMQVVELSKDGTRILDKGTIVFDGHKDHPTLEGPKFYKRNGYYYIFAPGGGVTEGWQTVLRSKHIYGPYEDKIVLAQGATNINGPHQGGWVELENGESWFIHFQDKGAYGRVPHLQPVLWIDDWPVMGFDADKDGTGEPVTRYQKPKTKGGEPITTPDESDEFDQKLPGLQWQWNANPKPQLASLSANPGFLRLFAIGNEAGNLWNSPNLLTQKIPAMEFSATAKLNIQQLRPNEEAGLIIFGLDYGSIAIRRDGAAFSIRQLECLNADKGTVPEETARKKLDSPNEIWLRVNVGKEGLANYFYSTDGQAFTKLGMAFKIKEGKWVGAKIALYATKDPFQGVPGYVDIDWVRINPLQQ